ncbi:MAG: cytochrome b/b6 domain-containing protein [Deltaproteobacteria bacterium]|nr:cytochrome b/b6 domain-containing protein [Deltaproteobacteria bacterium]
MSLRALGGGAAGRLARRRRRSGLARYLGVLLLAASAVVQWGAGSAWAEDDETPCETCHDAAPSALAGSVHEAFGCIDCHPGADHVPHEKADLSPTCTGCHDDAYTDLATSVHANGKAEKDIVPKDCERCHGTAHSIVSSDDPKSPLNPANVADTCGKCHGEHGEAHDVGFGRALPIAAYKASVHARAAGDGRHGPVCSSCHGSHTILPPEDPKSAVNAHNVADTCGKCHEKIAAAYKASIHGEAVAHGVREAPTCIDCHGEHQIAAPDELGSPVSASNVPKMTCGRCHGDIRLAQKFGFPADQVQAFEDSYHGLAMRTGSATVANCASCHGVHEIRPSSDPLSLVNTANLPTTCGKCHPGAGENFAITAVHVLPNKGEHIAVTWIRKIYVVMIPSVVGFMFLHNAADLFRKARSGISRSKRKAPPEERLSIGFRIAHAFTAVSFLVLVYTGFALKFPEAWWAAPLLSWEGQLGLRGLIHRVAGAVMTGALGLHLVHVAVDRKARACILQMIPGRADAQELTEKLRWMAGYRKSPPHSPTLGYPEKMEYLAFLWGSLVMAVSGFMLWFSSITLQYLPKWALDVATALHYYEAVLAALSILIWHFFVIFDPVVYPMDTAWLTGRSPAGRVLERMPEDDERRDDEDD